MEKHILGFPRIGVNRELKKALEGYWRGSVSAQELVGTCQYLKERHWAIQNATGLTFVTTGDFSLYDHILDTTMMLGAVPERFHDGELGLATYFRMARGDVSKNIPAMEMTKWFNTNYHYIVPEISSSQKYKLSLQSVVGDTRRAIQCGYRPKPVLVGPITYLSLAKGTGGHDCWSSLDAILDVYCAVLSELDPLCKWIQLDEPILCANMAAKAREAFTHAYTRLNASVQRAKLLLTTYFDTLDDNMDIALSSGCGGVHVDAVRGLDNLDCVIGGLPSSMTLSVGVVDGRNIWKTDYEKALETLHSACRRIPSERLMIGSSCSLLHSPIDLESEQGLDPEIRSWMAFAVQKCGEIALLGEFLNGRRRDDLMQSNRRAIRSRKESPRVHNSVVQSRCAAISDAMLQRHSPYIGRKNSQKWLNLPMLPTTTIGSFPQTSKIRTKRKLFTAGTISRDQYEAFLREEIESAVREQEELGLDVLVHGEPERNDMVEYFGKQLEGFCFTSNGWVQSYGSRCVKPPVIYGDVYRLEPMTVKWIMYAASLTDKPMKGMLTGPVTILCWSFVRDDLERAEVCRQLALAVRDEVCDLEKAGVRIIQIDEAAFSEGMPVKQKDRAVYLQWAVDCFRLATSGVADGTQIHSHMCYSDFNGIIDSIAAMDADVISIESSRSGMTLLQAFTRFEYPNDIGPGIYDIHSPRIPEVEELVNLLQAALRYIPKERLWVNPDCGLKTREWPETRASLRNMVAAALQLRTQI